MKVGIICCGLIGNKRANAIGEGHELCGVCDLDISKAEKLAAQKGVKLCTADYKELIAENEIDIIIISTLNNQLAPITMYAVQHGKHVIVEKPGALRPAELLPVIEEAEKQKVVVKVGFNHRYHPAMQKAKEIIMSGVTGEVMFIRGRYGHGGRVGYEKEWRADASLSGGGETIDQGVHLIDLARWYMGDFDEVMGFADTYFWDMPVDDNGFIGLRKKDGRAAWLQVSCTEWKNMFSLEIYCKNTKLAIEGLGGSYGVEKLYHYQMLPEMGPPDTTIYEYPRGDKSWELEFKDVVKAVEEGRGLESGGLRDAYEALRVVEKIYGRKDQC
ncbi:MAG: Gfo/Idh/MocA family oxidoreductase [Lachnospiraceae bacterium]|nr:Gfo/Idh/MocA family oxidoreductase [Lachnospiraceae bacterium]